jgi:hypothetical protein
MRDLLSKLDAIISETQLNPNDPKGDYEAKKKSLQDLENDPVAAEDPEIAAAIDQRKTDLEKEAKQKGVVENFEIGDEFGISFAEDLEIGTTITEILEDGIVIDLDDDAVSFLESQGIKFFEGELVEGVAGPKSCWKGYRKVGTKPGTGRNAGKRVNDCEKIGENLDEYFFFDDPKKKDRGPRDSGHDELDRRAKSKVDLGGRDARDYKDAKKKGQYKISGPKGKLPEDHGPENPDASYNVGEYDREGDMAKDDLRTINDAAKELYSIIKADENLPEWVQAKIVKAMDYLDTARDYMKANKYAEDTEVDEARKPAINFDGDDIQKLITIDDLPTLKAQAFDLISKPSQRPMKPEKVEWFKNALERIMDKKGVIKLMYDLMLSGEGHGVIGTRSSMGQSNYRKRFADDINEGDVSTGNLQKMMQYTNLIGNYVDDPEAKKYVNELKSMLNWYLGQDKESNVDEAKYQGREVPLGKKMAGDVKKSKVYVRKPNGNIVKVNFGDKKMRIKKSNPARRKSFRARHNCKNPGPRWKARYWSCRSW